MKKALFFFVFVSIFDVWGQSVPADEIVALRQRVVAGNQTVSESDISIIDRFWRISMDAMLLSDDPTQLVAIRRQIEQERGADPLTFYATAYVQTGRSHLVTAFDAVKRWTDTERQALMERNLMILTAQLQSPLLIDPGLERLNHSDEVVRYWAVKSLTSPVIAQQIGDAASADAALAEKVLTALAQRAAVESSFEILQAIVRFAAMVNRVEARQILMAAAQRRMKAYQEWTVDNESFDAVLLRTMGQVVLADRDSESRAAMMRGFAELFSMVFQRYLYQPSPLTEQQKGALLNVIVEVDNQILSKMMGQQTAILRAIQRPTGGLDREYETLFGSEAGAGQLAGRMNFNYGRTPEGRVVHAPPKLPPPKP